MFFMFVFLSVQSLFLLGWWEEPVPVLVYWRWNTRESGDQWMVGLTGIATHHLLCVDSWTVALLFQLKGVLVPHINWPGGLRLPVLGLRLH